jgi:hypothetical protein
MSSLTLTRCIRASFSVYGSSIRVSPESDETVDFGEFGKVIDAYAVVFEMKAGVLEGFW